MFCNPCRTDFLAIIKRHFCAIIEGLSKQDKKQKQNANFKIFKIQIFWKKKQKKQQPLIEIIAIASSETADFVKLDLQLIYVQFFFYLIDLILLYSCAKSFRY